MPDEYTPTTEGVRLAYAMSLDTRSPKDYKYDQNAAIAEWDRIRDAAHAAFDCWLAEHEFAQGQWEYQCRLTPYRDGTIPAWTTVDSGHRCGGELRRRWVGNWEEVENA